jgi:adenine-specific DNA-methyltransferase
MNIKQKLELTWVGKENRPRLEPRILLEDPNKSYHSAHRISDTDLFDNRLIFGDNLLALKALEQEFTGAVKCIFIDPPYNTGSAFEHFDDGLEHSIWLGLMRDRLELLKTLLSSDGSIWITIDDNEAHYLKVVCDEVFGRANFVASFVWQKTLTRRNDARVVSVAHDYVLLYARNRDFFSLNRVDSDARQRATYTNRDHDPRGDWLAVPFHAPNIRPNLSYPIQTPGGRVLMPPAGRCWSTTEERYRRLLADNRIYFGRDGNGMAQRKKFWSETEQGMVPWTWWPYNETGENREANREAKAIADACRLETVFATPKPERLLRRILQIATNPGDLVLDSFAGSGTTGAVAQKMQRRWIMVEVEEHCNTYIIPRLRLVIDGRDSGGITEEAGWKGGGGFRYFRLAPSLLEVDKWGRQVISKAYNAEMLAEALCKIEGFSFSPSSSHYWQQGHSSERDFIYVTTQTLAVEQLQQLSDEVSADRTLLVLCSAFRGSGNRWANLTVRKIPNHIRSRCEWGHDDYSLNVENLPKASPSPKIEAAAMPHVGALQPTLFGATDGNS